MRDKKLWFILASSVFAWSNAQATINFDAFYNGQWLACSADSLSYTFGTNEYLTLTGFSSCSAQTNLDFVAGFNALPLRNPGLRLNANPSQFNVDRLSGSIGDNGNPLRFELTDANPSELFTSATINGQSLTVKFSKESANLLGNYNYRVTVNNQEDQITNIISVSDTSATIGLASPAKQGEKVVLSYTQKSTNVLKNFTVTNLTVTSSAIALASCSDNSNGINSNVTIDKVVCTDTKGKSVIIINPKASGETGLPGCAGNLNANPSQCGSLSFTNETYAIRLKFNGIDEQKAKGSRFSVSFDTENAMIRIDQEFRRFKISISASPGYFPETPTKCDSLSGFAFDSILVANSGTNDSATCKLTPGQMYYINIKPNQEYCNSGSVESPGRACRVVVINNIPGSGAPLPL